MSTTGIVSDTRNANPLTTDPTEGRVTIFSDLNYAFALMRQHLNAAYASRGIVVQDDIEFKETCEEAVGCVVAYILTYARSRTRPVMTSGQSALMQLAERLSNVFNSVSDAAMALHDVETVALEAIAEVLPEHNNFEVMDWQVRLYTLVIFIRLTPTPNLNYTPPKPPDWSTLDWTVQVQPMKDVDPDKLLMVMPYMAPMVTEVEGFVKKFYPESSWPKNEKDPQQFGEEFVIYMPGPEPADGPPPVQVEWLDDAVAHPTEPKKIVEPGDGDTLDNMSF